MMGSFGKVMCFNALCPQNVTQKQVNKKLRDVLCVYMYLKHNIHANMVSIVNIEEKSSAMQLFMKQIKELDI